MSKASILIVEDETVTALELRQRLTELGYGVEWTTQPAASALDRVTALHPDLVLLDIRLNQRVAGLTVAEHLQGTHHVPVVLLRAEEAPAERPPVALVGAHGYLRRPFDEQHLQVIVEMALYRHRMEASARQQKAWLAATLESIDCAVLTTDADGRVTYLNPAAESLLGRAPGHAYGRLVTNQLRFTPPIDLMDGVDRSLHGCLDGGTGRIPVEGQVRHLQDEAGAPVGTVVALRDVSARLQAEETARQQQERLREVHKLEALGRLASGIAHDFNNLLTAITGYSELVLMQMEHTDPHYEHVTEIMAAGDRAVELTRQLLTFGRRQKLSQQVVNLNDLVGGMKKLLGRLIGERVEIALAADPNLGTVKADPTQLEQVVLNLVINARDAMPNGGQILIETANIDLTPREKRHPEVRPGSYVMLSVQDTGSGMTEEVLAHLFDPFFTTKDAGQGTGLGLATVYGIVKQSDGDIWVDSAAGQGSRFRIYLPRVDEPVAAPAPAPVDRILGGHETILVVEDEPITRTMIRWALTRYGYTVLEAGHPGEALLIAEQHAAPIHLVLTDIVMPRLTGPELSQRLLSGRPELRILYMSAYTPDEITRYGIDVAVDVQFLAKPFTPGALAYKVRQMLDQPDRSARRSAGRR